MTVSVGAPEVGWGEAGARWQLAVAAMSQEVVDFSNTPTCCSQFISEPPWPCGPSQVFSSLSLWLDLEISFPLAWRWGR